MSILISSKDDADFERVSWQRIYVKPRAVFHDEDERGKELMRAHSILLIETRDDKKYVLDVSGYQFGFPSTFYSWEQYLHFLKSENCVVERGLAAEETRYRLQSADDDGGAESITAVGLRLADFLEEREIREVKSWFG